MDKICGIYKITSPTGRLYIGKSKNMKRRFGEYKNRKDNGSFIQRSIVKHGWDLHVFEVVHECDESELNKWEKYYIKAFDTFNTEHGMNLTEGGDCAKMSEVTKAKMKVSKKINNFWVGRKHSEESKEKMREGSKGNKNNLGKKRTEESKAKMSIAHKGKKLTEKARLGVIRGLIGRKLSDETKRKISIANKGRTRVGKPHSEETKLKCSLAMKGRKYPDRTYSDETRKKLGDVNRGKTFYCNYSIYNQNNELVYDITTNNIKQELIKLKLSRDPLCDTYRKNKPVTRGNYKGWYMTKNN